MFTWLASRCLLILLAAAYCSSCAKKPAGPPKKIQVTTYIVEPQTVPAVLTFVGVAESSHLVEIFSRVEGYLWKIAYQEGSLVKGGDLLFQIDPRPFEAAVDQARAEVDRQNAALWASEQAVKRFKPLYEQKAASQRDLDNAIARELEGQASVEAAKAKLVEAALNLSYTGITSPITGLSGRAKYREGTLINPAVNGLLTSVSVIDPIWVYFSISDAYLLSNREELQKNQLKYPENNDFSVLLTLSDGSQFPHSGKINFASPTLDQNTGTMTVRAEFVNPEGILRPGQFVRANVVGATRPNAIIVPQQCVQQGAKGMYVYAVNQGQAEMRFVEVGDWYNNYWIIKSGLQKGDEVIVDGVNKVREGTLIEVIPNTPSNQKTTSQ